jgi:NAD(P)-dependent dehydrogenase (short-subunit alcohol dehydrogenase family)
MAASKAVASATASAAASASKWTVQQIPSQTGKIALVTGANSGIGYQAALELARHGAHVLLGCRDAAKGQAALERLRREAPGSSAEVVALDMASLGSIAEFAAKFAARGVPLDLLINNAGVMALPKREVTADGFERQFGTNHLGHFALTGRLMPQLLAAPTPRVVTVASLAHRNGKIDFDNLQRERGYEGWDAYNASKLANILFANELDRQARVAHSKLMSLAVHPGISRTNIMANGPGEKNLKAYVIQILAPIMLQSDDAGALPTLYAATSPDAKGGQYIGPDGFQEFKGSPVVVKARPQALDEAVGKRLWTVSEKLTGVNYPPLG